MSDITFEKQNGTNLGAAPSKPRARRAVAPPIDVFENADELLVVADVPGVAGDGIDLRVENGILRLEAKRAAAENASPALAREYEDVDYVTTFRIPAGIDTAAISAQTKNGTLQVHLPKAQAAKPRKIAVS
ncbi:MAG TPA: Hsp20/alpha crystallin family protein [Polyangiaceae bacterium]|jgi:HSP20 family molecular chaperone IbpA